MSYPSNSSWIYDHDPNREIFNALFDQNRSQETPKPFSHPTRKMPRDFIHPPRSGRKSKDRIEQRDQKSSGAPNTLLYSRPAKSLSHQKSASATAAIVESIGENSKASLLPLPDGWEEKVTDNGQTYYIDHLTESTTWVDPRPKHYAAFQLYCTTLPLPEGYGKTTDSKGNIYFIDHKHQQTYWDDPRPQYYQSSMRKRLDLPSSTSTVLPPQEDDVLKKQLVDITKERHALELRIQELARLEVNLRQRVDHHSIVNNPSGIDQSDIGAWVDKSRLYQRKDSADSRINDDQPTRSQPIGASNSTLLSDDFLSLDSSDYEARSLVNDSSLQNTYTVPRNTDF